ncbi:MAG: SRPBCC family protein [Burkholderiales bacterium]|nr:SRPBCC family protein [Burkholderiales bacterium]
MSQGVRFERSHEIAIDAPAGDILDYVSNPNSWPEWIAASHHIDSPPRPLAAGERFSERWHTRTGEVLLEWLVTERDHPRLWVAQTRTDFIGTIIVRYEVETAAGGSRYRRTLINPARPKAPTADMIRRIDEEAAVSLQNIKRAVEARRGGA